MCHFYLKKTLSLRHSLFSTILNSAFHGSSTSVPRQYGHTYIRDFNALPLSTAFHMEMDGKEKDIGKKS